MMNCSFVCEPMCSCEIFIRKNNLYNVISSLGELGIVEFMDNNRGPILEKPFSANVKKWFNLEQKIAFMQQELLRYDLTCSRISNIPSVPGQNELINLESQVENMEQNIRNSKLSLEKLQKSFVDFSHKKILLLEILKLLENPIKSCQAKDDDILSNGSNFPHSFITGVMCENKFGILKKVLWRIYSCKVCIAKVSGDLIISDTIKSYENKDCAFIINFTGCEKPENILELCKCFSATLHPCPENYEGLKTYLDQIRTNIADMNLVINKELEAYYRLLSNVSLNINDWFIKVLKVKSTYAAMNLFSEDRNQDIYTGKLWVSEKSEGKLQELLQENSSSDENFIRRIENMDDPPSFNIVNKFTNVFQELINSYSIPSYTDINPVPFWVVTLPFYFAILFADAGHGFIMLLFSFWMIYKEEFFYSKGISNDVFKKIFHARYVVLLMGVFSIYTGLIYNHCFSKPLNLFGSSWDITNVSNFSSTPITVHPQNGFIPYPFGVDPIWESAKNKLMFFNSLQIKVSLIFGSFHIMLGILLTIYKQCKTQKYKKLVYKGIPQLLFLLASYGYISVLILVKWVAYNFENASCAPHLVTVIIKMIIWRHPRDNCNLMPMYNKQEIVENCLLSVLSVSIFHLLFGKIFIQYFSGKNENWSKIFLSQLIKTVTFVFGLISNIASYFRLWAISLAHSQITEMLWKLTTICAFYPKGYAQIISIYISFSIWFFITVIILIVKESITALGHTLRLHWIEFHGKFFKGNGLKFSPFSFEEIVVFFKKSQNIIPE